jgi:hypothetical protein
MEGQSVFTILEKGGALSTRYSDGGTNLAVLTFNTSVKQAGQSSRLELQ